MSDVKTNAGEVVYQSGGDREVVLSEDYDALHGAMLEWERQALAAYDRIIALEAALRVAADLRESDIDGSDEFTFHWRSLLFGCSTSDAEVVK